MNTEQNDKKKLKSRLRDEYKLLRSNIVGRGQKDGEITDRVTAFLKSVEFNSLFSYVSMGSEVDTNQILQYYIKKPAVKLLVPYTDKNEMRPKILLNIDSITAPDKLGNIKGIESAKDFDGLPDVALVPMLAYSGGCYRLGYGGGYYDRFFSKNKPCLKIGLAFDCQFTNERFDEPFDVQLDVVITEKRIISAADKPYK